MAGPNEELDTFLDTANSIHRRIKLEMTKSAETISFLDALMKMTSIYTKDTDKHVSSQSLRSS